MGVKYLIFLIAVMFFISSCSLGDKTRPVVTDVGGEVSKEESPIVGNVIKEPAENKTEVVSVGEEDKTEEIKAEEEAEEKMPPGTHIITIKDLRLNPQELTIKKGDTIVWKHEDTWEQNGETRHLLYQHFGEFRTPPLYYGDTFNHTFNKTGTYTYNDAIYKDRDYMRGKIIVG